MYKSPVELITKQMHTQIEDYTFNAIQEVVANINKEELIRALEYDRDQYEQGYRDGINADKWVSVKDGLPTWEDGKVLIYTPYGVSVAERTVNDRWQGKHATPKLITHWMPLPEPPKEEN